MLLPHQEFLRRFEQHVLPKRFVKIRHFGYLRLQGKRERLAQIRASLNLEPPRPKVTVPARIRMLESLKMIFEMKKELFYKSTIKGVLAEDEIAEFLNQYFSEKRLKDRAFLTGNSAGNLPKNKTGDIICEVNGTPDLKLLLNVSLIKAFV
jgi:hypothetical protein